MRSASILTEECRRLELVARMIETMAEVETLRQIRNGCRDGFAHDNTEISPQAQTAWWIVHRSRVRAWLYWHGADVVGYGLLRMTDDGRWWSSVAVVPDAAGHGYGGAITADLIRRAVGVVWAEARMDQPRAMRLHREADWELLGYVDGLAQYRTREHVYDPVLTEWATTGMVVT